MARQTKTNSRLSPFRQRPGQSHLPQSAQPRQGPRKSPQLSSLILGKLQTTLLDMPYDMRYFSAYTMR